MGGPTQALQRPETAGNGAIPTIGTDVNSRASLNTVFGEKITGVRRSDIAAQFQYGYRASAATETTANGGTISISESMLTVASGTNAAGSAIISSRKALRYIAGQEAYINFTAVFTSPKADSYQRAGIFDVENGFFISYEGTDFKVTRRRDSVDTSVTIDIDSVFGKEYGTFDPTKGNIYKISYGYLGFAAISFEVMLPDGSWTLIHKIEYPNTSTGVHVLNTNLQPRVEAVNDGNASDIVVKIGSFAAGVVNGGGNDQATRRFTFGQTDQTITAGTLTVITFRSRSTFNSLTNYVASVLTLLSFNTDLSKSSLWEVEKNPTITNTPTWTDIDTLDSTIEYSTDATVTKDSGELSFSLPLGRIDRELITDLEEQEIEILPGDYITLFIVSPGGTTGTYDYSFRWKELF